MKTLFKIHPLTYLILFSVFFCGYFNYFLIISFILLIHDLGHIILIKILGYNIYNITILPFGSIINSNINSSIKSINLFFISIIGIINQLILYLFFYYLFNFGIINDISYNIFLYYNKLIIIFNLFPIIPLDGSKILLSILECIFPYKLSLKLINYISIIFIIILVLLNDINFNLFLIVIYLFIKTYIEIKNHNYIFNNFLFDRYINKIKNYKIKYINKIKRLYKNRYNFINNQNEDKILKDRFD